MEWWGLHIYIWTSLYWTINSFFVSNTISFYSCTDKGGMYDKGVSPLSSTKTCLKKKVFFWTFLSLERVEFAKYSILNICMSLFAKGEMFDKLWEKVLEHQGWQMLNLWWEEDTDDIISAFCPKSNCILESLLETLSHRNIFDFHDNPIFRCDSISL